MMRGVLTVALALAGLCIPAVAEAACLSSADRVELEAALVARFDASEMTIDELYDHAANHLGYGWAGAPGPRSHAHLAAMIADRLAAADSAVGAAAIDTTVAGIQSNGTEPYRFADDSLAEMYAAWGQRSNRGAIRYLTETRTVAQALAGPNLDLGTVLREFWFNHFNVHGRKAEWAGVGYQRKLRAKQCTTLYELLLRTASHPAMLIYLDNRRSVKGAINENYGRELLELHTFGDDTFQYYTQQDVVGVATVLTGWTFSLSEAPAFEFVEANHDPTTVTLFDPDAPGGPPSGTKLRLNVKNGESGRKRGKRLLRYLAGHEATRRNICTKLSIALTGVSTAALVDGCADDSVWGDRGDLSAMYQHFLTAEEMWSKDQYRAQWKNPLELVASARRAVGKHQVDRKSPLRRTGRLVEAMGQPVGQVAPPTGYTNDDQAWINAGNIVLWQAEVHASIATNSVRLATGSGVLKGDVLEDHVRTLMEGTPANATLNNFAREVGWALGIPRSVGLTGAAARRALRRADRTQASGETAPARTLIHALLTDPAFLRK